MKILYRRKEKKINNMKTMKNTTTVTSVVVATILFGGLGVSGIPNAYANELVTNGSFEDPAIGGALQIFASITGWDSTNGIEIQKGLFGGASDGFQHVELDVVVNSAMNQTLTTVAGTDYVLTFDYSPRPDLPPTTNSIEVYWDGNLIDTVTGQGAGGIANWNTQEYLVTATTESTNLEFVATGTSDSRGGLVDAVSVVSFDDQQCIETFGNDWRSHNSTRTDDTLSDDYVYVLKCLDTTDPCLNEQQGVELKDNSPTTCNGFGSIMYSNVETSILKDSLPAEWFVSQTNVEFLIGEECTVDGKKGNKQRGATVMQCNAADLGEGLYGAAIQVSDIETVQSPSNGKRNSCDGELVYKPTSFVLYANEGVQGYVLTELDEVRQIDLTPGDDQDDVFADFFAITEALPVVVVDNESPCPVAD
jgi:hypothetical protein